MGDLVEIGRWDADVVKSNAPQIMHFCATNGIGLTIQESASTTTLRLDGVIYSEGFNRDTFLKTLDSLNACVEQIHTLIPGSRHDRNAPSGYFCRRLAESAARSH